MVRSVESFGSDITVYQNLKASLEEMTIMSPESCDFNFCFPVRDLESDRVKITPFIVSTPLYAKERRQAH